MKWQSMVEVTCEWCRNPFTAQRSSARFCSPRHRYLAFTNPSKRLSIPLPEIQSHTHSEIRDSKPGIIYVITIDNAEAAHLYKIGRTREGGVEDRLASLQTGCPWPLRIVASYWCSRPVELELTVHQDLQRYHKLGEWFDLSRAGVKDPLQTIRTIIWKHLDDWAL